MAMQPEIYCALMTPFLFVVQIDSTLRQACIENVHYYVRCLDYCILLLFKRDIKKVVVNYRCDAIHIRRVPIVFSRHV